ncbi:MAG: hypothetical protein JSR26_03845 [Proteobacteria bacterium]|nr:hypothetical protein [Pseudomonadota bacterium]
MGGKKKPPVIGYRYYMGLHMGVTRGPVDELVAIKVGDKQAWSGSVTASGQISIDQPNLFGGDKGQGGIQGPLNVMMGEATQTAPGWLSKLHGALLPGFRKMFTLAFNGMVCAMNPNPQPWSVRCRRILKGWPNDNPWYPEKALIALTGSDGSAIHAMNPAHILYQCAVDGGFGRGLDPGYLDDASFRRAADTLYVEGFGLCLGWKRQGPINDFVQVVIDHIGAYMGVDPSSGLLGLTLVRADYDPATLPLFTPDSGLISVTDDVTAAQETQPNEIVVQWVDPITGNGGTTRVPNVAAVQNLGATVSVTKSYVGLPTEALAQRVGLRDAIAAGAGLRAFKVQLDRRAWALRPGQAFCIGGINGIGRMVLRAGKREDSVLTGGTITITAVQDVFGMPATTWLGSVPSTWTPPNQTPLPCPAQAVYEASYRDLSREIAAGDLAALTPDAAYLATVGARPSGLSLGYAVATEAAGETGFVARGSGAFTPVATLAAGIDGAATSIAFTGGIDMEQVAVGTAAYLDDEIVRIDAIDASAGTATIARGCVDTVPASHASGALLWCFDDFAGADEREYATGETVFAKLLVHTASGDLDPILAPVSTVTMAGRPARPYPPANVMIGGVLQPASVSGTITVTWCHRDRVLQADQLLAWADASVGPEPTTRYHLRFADAADATLAERTDLVGTTASAVLAYTGAVTMTISTITDRGESWQAFSCVFTYTPPDGIAASSITGAGYTPATYILDGGGA